MSLPSRPHRALLAMLAPAVLLTACAIPQHPDTSAPAPDPFNPAATQLLDNTSWTLASWQQAGGQREIPQGERGSAPTLTLSTASGQRRASGFSGCNRFMSRYTLKDGKLGFGPVAGTRMACGQASMELEHNYLQALEHIDRTGVQERPPQQLQLILENGDTLTFDRQADKSAP